MATSPPATFAFTKLVVRDLERSAAFYRAVCGYGEGHLVRSTIAGRRMRELIFRNAAGATEMMLLAYDDGPAPSGEGVITGFNTPDLDAFEARLLAAGGTVLDPIATIEIGDVKIRLAFYFDCEGYGVEAIER